MIELVVRRAPALGDGLPVDRRPRQRDEPRDLGRIRLRVLNPAARRLDARPVVLGEAEDQVRLGGDAGVMASMHGLGIQRDVILGNGMQYALVAGLEAKAYHVNTGTLHGREQVKVQGIGPAVHAEPIGARLERSAEFLDPGPLDAPDVIDHHKPFDAVCMIEMPHLIMDGPWITHAQEPCRVAQRSHTIVAAEWASTRAYNRCGQSFSYRQIRAIAVQVDQIPRRERQPVQIPRRRAVIDANRASLIQPRNQKGIRLPRDNGVKPVMQRIIRQR